VTETDPLLASYENLYFDRAGQPVDVLTWARLFEDPTRQVGHDSVRRWDVSTCWMGTELAPWIRLARSMEAGVHLPPLVYETMVFLRGGSSVWRTVYATEEQAHAGHLAVVKRIAAQGDFWTRVNKEFARILTRALRNTAKRRRGPRPLPVDGREYRRRRAAR
jgi:hypothetical protein